MDVFGGSVSLGRRGAGGSDARLGIMQKEEAQ